MPRKSIAIISKTDLENWRRDLCALLSSLPEAKLAKFLEEFLTEEEEIMLIKRLQLYNQLFQDVSVRQIQQTLGISHETTRLYQALKNQKSNDFKQIIGKFTKPLPKNSKSLDTIKKVGRLIELVGESNNDMKARAKLYQGNLD